MQYCEVQENKMIKNSTLYQLGSFIRDIGEDPAVHIHRVNSMLSEPLGEHDINTILKSIR